MDAQQIATTKSDLQGSWLGHWKKTKRGTLAGATGMGKTKPSVDTMMELWRGWKALLSPEDIVDGPAIRPPKIFLAVPTEKLRDEGWPEEVENWYGEEGKEMWDTCVTAVCYISIHKYRGSEYDLVIFDEIHWITPLSSTFFENNKIHAVMGLTATAPNHNRDPEKYDIIKKYAPIIFSYSLDQGVEDGVIADFEINVVMIPLDHVTKNIPAGTKAKPFMTTEAAHYEWLCGSIKKLYVLQKMNGDPNIEKRIMYTTLKRTRFIYNLPSKTAFAKKLMEHVISDKRTLIFCGSIEQSRTLCGTEVYNSKDNSNGKFEEFKSGKGTFLGVVNAANEGHNIADLDQAIIVQVNSNERHLVQRIGRTVRVREGHKAVAWVLCSQGTMDENWVEKSLANIDRSKIRYWSHKEFI